jgi:hypothetical protein
MPVWPKGSRGARIRSRHANDIDEGMLHARMLRDISTLYPKGSGWDQAWRQAHMDAIAAAEDKYLLWMNEAN